MNARQSRLAAKLLAGAAVCVLVAGCVPNPFADAKVDPRSPIASEVATSVRPNAAYPTFRSIPPTPKDLRPRKQYGVQAAQVETAGAELAKATSDTTWTLGATESFAAQAQKDAGPDLPPPEPADTEAFAKSQKARATPPPSPPR